MLNNTTLLYINTYFSIYMMTQIPIIHEAFFAPIALILLDGWSHLMTFDHMIFERFLPFKHFGTLRAIKLRIFV